MEKEIYGLAMPSPIALLLGKQAPTALWFESKEDRSSVLLLFDSTKQQAQITVGHTKTLNGEVTHMPYPVVLCEGRGDMDTMQAGSLFKIPCGQGVFTNAQRVSVTLKEDLLHDEKRIAEADASPQLPLTTKEVESRVGHFQDLDKFLKGDPEAAKQIDLHDERTEQALRHMFGDNGYMVKPPEQFDISQLEDTLICMATVLGPQGIMICEDFKNAVEARLAEHEDASRSAERDAIMKELDRMEEKTFGEPAQSMLGEIRAISGMQRESRTFDSIPEI